MSSEPTFPKDAKVGDPAPLNETLTAAVTAKQAEAGAKDKSSNRSFVRGAAIGVGSAAVMAALLYANNRVRRGDKGHGADSPPTTTTTPLPPRDDD